MIDISAWDGISAIHFIIVLVGISAFALSNLLLSSFIEDRWGRYISSSVVAIVVAVFVAEIFG